MTDVEKILAKCDDLEEATGSEGAFRLYQELKPIIRALLKDRARLIEACKSSCWCGSDPDGETKWCHACQALEQSAQTTREIIGGKDE